MHYLITISLHGFIKLKTSEITNEAARGGNNSFYTITTFTPNIDIKTEINDDSLSSEYGEVITSILSKLKTHASILHFNTFIVNYQGNIEDLMAIVTSELNQKDMATIAEISNLQISYFDKFKNETLRSIFNK